MQFEWSGCLIFSEARDDETFEAWLEHAEDGYIGTGDTESAARADLIDQLRADALNEREQREAAMDDMAHARRSAAWEARP